MQDIVHRIHLTQRMGTISNEMTLLALAEYDCLKAGKDVGILHTNRLVKQDIDQDVYLGNPRTGNQVEVAFIPDRPETLVSHAAQLGRALAQRCRQHNFQLGQEPAFETWMPDSRKWLTEGNVAHVSLSLFDGPDVHFARRTDTLSHLLPAQSGSAINLTGHDENGQSVSILKSRYGIEMLRSTVLSMPHLVASTAGFNDIFSLPDFDADRGAHQVHAPDDPHEGHSYKAYGSGQNARYEIRCCSSMKYAEGIRSALLAGFPGVYAIEKRDARHTTEELLETRPKETPRNLHEAAVLARKRPDILKL